MEHPRPSVVDLLDGSRRKVARRLSELHFSRHPGLEEQYGPEGRQKCFEDALYHLDYLKEAVRAESGELFSRYLEWARSMLQERKIPAADLVDHLVLMKEVLQEALPSGAAATACRYIDAGLEHLAGATPAPDTFLRPENPLLKEARDYLGYLLEGERNRAAGVIDRLTDKGISVRDMYEHIFQPTQYEIGLLWQTNRITVAHEHYCTASTQLMMSRLYPLIFSSVKTGGKLIACSVEGELHEIGIRMVADLFEMDGWDTYYMGANMPDRDLIGTLSEYEADVLAISVTLPIHLDKAEALIRAVRTQKELDEIRILAGGYPFRIVPGLWKQLGADGTAESASGAIEIANSWAKNA